MGMSEQIKNMSIAQFLIAERSRLVSYVRRLIDDAADRDGEDIVQEVAASLLSRADILMPIEILSAYVYQSLRHRVIDYLRRRRNLAHFDETMEDEGNSHTQQISDVMADAEKELTRSELRRAIFEAVEGLPDEQKAVIIETELNGRSFRDLSRQWQIPIGTLLARKSRALAKVREALREFKP
ncbi:MAG: sigma-70 family RNA polymerase sigma factor [Deltaproteobacteria bacterium]|nr:sigma-70 family RNA polymerase sigma factor [Deltaproteobacteria bacterium]